MASSKEEEGKKATSHTVRTAWSCCNAACQVAEREGCSMGRPGVCDERLTMGCLQEWRRMTVVKGVSIADEMNASSRPSMEDTHLAMDGLGKSSTSAFFAVFDGHGGREVAEYVTRC